MDSKHHNPNANVPAQSADEPRGDRGRGNQSWAPEQSKQGISNRPGDQAAPTAAGPPEPDALNREDLIEDNVDREEIRNSERATDDKVNARRARTAGGG